MEESSTTIKILHPPENAITEAITKLAMRIKKNETIKFVSLIDWHFSLDGKMSIYSVER